ncbi:uncharacterized protein LOC121416953 [Lytechinus variegatus]|uniref:uncharacterized protein LOC121416953 n=1 Tax=Lytechinus variegatus TaxID=7654 RepID=UPI001BB2142C|nr:uncharacterized protein LOC121416953 [Lytechinus variegatus]
MASLTSEQQARVMMWCTPRSISSVFCKCLSFVPDIDVFFDTYYFAYEAEIDLGTIGKVVDHDAGNIDEADWVKAAEMICEEKCDNRVKLDMLKYPVIKSMLDNPDPNKKAIFYKGVSQSMDSKHYRFLPDKSSNYKHSFFLRHPAKVFSSWKKVIHSILRDVGDGTGKKLTKSLEDFDIRYDVPEKYKISGLLYKELHDLWVYVLDNLDPDPVVVESDDLLADPAAVLSKYCKAVGIQYNDSLLSWDANPDITDNWKCAFMPVKEFEFIRIFCHNAFHTSHFLAPPPVPSFDDLPNDVREIAELSMPYYNKMYKTRLIP